MEFRFNYKESTLNSGLNRMSEKLGAVILMYSSTKASKLESLMKQNRPWTDRTGMAKALLSARVSQPDSHTVRITLAHGVEYSIWLELANEKNYAIIAPTIRNEGPRVISDLGDIMARLKL